MTLNQSSAVSLRERLTIAMLRLIYGSRYNAINTTSKSSLWVRFCAPFRILRRRIEWPRVDAPRLRQLRNVHDNDSRVFIICNGPSINSMDLSPLKNEISFGVNAIYLKFNELGFKPTYYVVEDNLVAEDRADDINRLSSMTRFYPLRLAFCLKRTPEVIFLNHCPKETRDLFSIDASVETHGGNTVTYTCLELAFHMGFRRVYLVGADHSYELPEEVKGRDQDENYVIESREDDPNHFDGAYFGKGYRWHNPKVHKMERAYRVAKKVYEAHGREIRNATQGGKLKVFERVNFEDLF